MQIICTSLQTDNHASTSTLILQALGALLMPSQQRQSIEGDKFSQVSTYVFSRCFRRAELNVGSERVKGDMQRFFTKLMKK